MDLPERGQRSKHLTAVSHAREAREDTLICVACGKRPAMGDGFCNWCGTSVEVRDAFAPEEPTIECCDDVRQPIRVEPVRDAKSCRDET